MAELPDHITLCKQPAIHFGSREERSEHSQVPSRNTKKERSKTVIQTAASGDAGHPLCPPLYRINLSPFSVTKLEKKF